MNARDMPLSPLTAGQLLRVSLILLLVFGPINRAAAEDQSSPVDAVQFIVIGDWGTPNSAGQKKVAVQMDRLASRVPIDFIVTTGDNFYMKGVQSVDDPLWQTTFEKIYSLPALKNIPWYVTLGNHDYMGNIHAQIAYAQSHDNWNLPQTYYSTEFKIDSETSVRFLFLDTSPFLEEYTARPGFYRHIGSQDKLAQLRWMDKTLTQSNATWHIAVGHHPVYSSGRHGDTNSLKDVLSPLFEREKVQAYFAGHDHHLEHYQLVGSTHYFISGGGSRIRAVSKSNASEFAASSLGFAHVILDKACMQVRFINEKGVQLYQTGIPAGGGESCQ